MTRRNALYILAVVFVVILAYRAGQIEAYTRGFDRGYTTGYDYATGDDWGEYPNDQYTAARSGINP
jgi:hypothetical protein